jgi:para-nitrobenzyl esterase
MKALFSLMSLASAAMATAALAISSIAAAISSMAAAIFVSSLAAAILVSSPAAAQPIVHVANGRLQGVVETSGIISFKGIPFAQPPVGPLRFREPQPPADWTGVRKADAFGPRAMQLPIYSDMQFRSNGVSEDCLYLNVWTPSVSPKSGLPVLVYFYGGGFSAGDGSEYRYDGESMAKRGIVAVTVNYRLGIFGLLALPALTKESPHHASGNYGLLDQHAALEWVKKNIASFGGDPARVTIAGESAGSMSVSAQMASPLSKGLFEGVIGESGALFGNSHLVPLSVAEQTGQTFAGGNTLADLRAMPADDLLTMAKSTHFPVDIDGYFLPESPTAIFAAGRQMKVPLLAGWNSAESIVLDTSSSHFTETVRQTYGAAADTILQLYPPSDPARSATALASDHFIAYSTWKWIHLALKTGGKPVYQYQYAHPRPGQNPIGAGHSWEIEYALGNLHTNTVYAWTPEDDQVSSIMQTYFANFIKSGDPNSPDLLHWPALTPDGTPIMVIDVTPRLSTETHAARYAYWDMKY